MKAKSLMVMAAMALSSICFASPKTQKFAAGTMHQECFVPDGYNCESMLVSAINNSKHQILVQAYGFTNKAIADALIAAEQRGVDVELIIDKSLISNSYYIMHPIEAAGIKVWADTNVAIAHNKVMIFDNSAVFTGSFNFTEAAAKKNAENGTIIQGDANYVNEYTSNWYNRKQVSTFIR